MKRAISITTLFLDIGGVLLTNGWEVFVNLLREAIKQSPEYTEESLLTRAYETALHRHYNRQGYWVDDSAAEKHSR